MRRSQNALSLLSFLALPVLYLFATAIFLGTTASGAAAAESKRVLMLHSFGPRFKPWSTYAETIRSEINRQSRKSVDFVDQSLVNARVSDAQSEAPFVDYLSALYAGHPLDLIIAFGGPAATFVQQHRQRLFPRVPMVVTAVDHRRVQYEKLTENDTVVPVTNDVPAVFENVLHVLPGTKTIAILIGASPIERFWTEELRRELAPLANRVQLKWYNELPFDDILKDVENLPPHSAIFSVLMNVDAAGVVQETGNALNKVASRANAPIFSYDDSYFDGAIVGGPMFSMLEGSRIAATVATRILDGEKAGDIKTPPIKYASPKYDWRQMQRWGISESNLPPGSSIHFRPPTAWETYHWQIVTACAVVLLQGALIMLLLLEQRRRHLAEMDSRQRVMELAHVNRFSTAGELSASLAHEINQPLGAILTNTETAQLMLQSPSPDLGEMKEILADIWRDNRRAGEVVRRLRSFVTKAPFQTAGVRPERSGCRIGRIPVGACEVTRDHDAKRADEDAAPDLWRSDPVATGRIQPCSQCDGCRPGYTTRSARRDGDDKSRPAVCRDLCRGHRTRRARRKSRQRYLSHFFRPRTTAWAWVFRSPVRSSRRTMDR